MANHSILAKKHMPRDRDIAVDVMLTLGIIFVVMGHNHQPPSFFFPAYAFHMPLFFFISGYLFSIGDNWSAKKDFVVKKCKTQLAPYFVFEIVFLLITKLLEDLGFFNKVNLSVRALLIEPFYSGHQIPLMIPMWFLLQLFVLNVVFQLIYWRKAKVFTWLLTLPIFLIGLYMAKQGLAGPQGFALLVARTGIVAIFFQMGIIVAQHKVVVSRITRDPLFLFVSWMGVAVISALIGNISYSIVWGSVENRLVFIPLFTSAIIVLMVFGFSQLLSQTIDRNNLFLKIGRGSFWIMSLHLICFFLVNFSFYKIGLIGQGKLSDVYFQHEVGKYFFLYLGAGIVLPLAVAAILRSARSAFLNRIRRHAVGGS